jgi:hypothetical protein
MKTAVAIMLVIAALPCAGQPVQNAGINDGHHQAAFSNAISSIHLPPDSRSHAAVDAAVQALIKPFADECASLGWDEAMAIDHSEQTDFARRISTSDRHQHVYTLIQAAARAEGDLQEAMLRKRIALEKEFDTQVRNRLGLPPEK